jgi:hypothetical protein
MSRAFNWLCSAAGTAVDATIFFISAPHRRCLISAVKHIYIRATASRVEGYGDMGSVSAV